MAHHAVHRSTLTPPARRSWSRLTSTAVHHTPFAVYATSTLAAMAWTAITVLRLLAG